MQCWPHAEPSELLSGNREPALAPMVQYQLLVRPLLLTVSTVNFNIFQDLNSTCSDVLDADVKNWLMLTTAYHVPSITTFNHILTWLVELFCSHLYHCSTICNFHSTILRVTGRFLFPHHFLYLQDVKCAFLFMRIFFFLWLKSCYGLHVYCFNGV